MPSMIGVPLAVIVVTVEFPNMAMPLGTDPVDQLTASLKLEVAGLSSQLASWAYPVAGASQPQARHAARHRRRYLPPMLSAPITPACDNQLWKLRAFSVRRQHGLPIHSCTSSGLIRRGLLHRQRILDR